MIALGLFEEDATEAIVYHGEDTLAQITLNAPGDGLFDEEREELIEFANVANWWRKRRVLNVLRAAKQIVGVQVLFGDGDTESTLSRIDPLWEWLAKNRTGLMQADARVITRAAGSFSPSNRMSG